MKQKIIAVIGDSECPKDIENIAYEAGRLIAEKGAMLICGGYGGVMSAAARGARDAGGITIGILSGKDRTGVSDAIQIPIVTGMGDARNAIIIASADGVIAISGGFGTLSEIGFALKFKVPIVGIQTWGLIHKEPIKSQALQIANSPKEAVAILFKECK